MLEHHAYGDAYGDVAQKYLLLPLRTLTRRHGTLSIVVAASSLSVTLSLLLTVFFNAWLRGYVPLIDIVIGGVIPLIISPLALYSFVALVHRLDQTERHLHRLASEDGLTGAFNRRYVLTLAEHEWARADRYGGALSLIMLDVDHFKRVNDTYGHAAGDSVLQMLADTCRAHLRRSDIFGRLGGEEFLILLPGTDERAALRVGEHLRSVLEATRIELESCQLRITVSAGVASRGVATRDLEHLIKEADDALYAAKSAGRNQVKTNRAA